MFKEILFIIGMIYAVLDVIHINQALNNLVIYIFKRVYLRDVFQCFYRFTHFVQEYFAYCYVISSNYIGGFECLNLSEDVDCKVKFTVKYHQEGLVQVIENLKIRNLFSHFSTLGVFLA